MYLRSLYFNFNHFLFISLSLRDCPGIVSSFLFLSAVITDHMVIWGFTFYEGKLNSVIHHQDLCWSLKLKFLSKVLMNCPVGF